MEIHTQTARSSIDLYSKYDPASHRAHRLNVYLTIDTEVWPAVVGWPTHTRLDSRHHDLAERVATDLYGTTDEGDFGLEYQIGVFDKHALKANFFIEALAWGRLGQDGLRRAVELILNHGHDVQLHLHTEWLSDLSDSDLPPAFRQYMHQFSVEEQTALIAKGLGNLAACGATTVRAFRAGSYGANFDTLKALAQNTIFIDTSHNPCYVPDVCRLDFGAPLLQVRRVGSVAEFPVAVFEDYPGHLRPAQLCACSLSELTYALRTAWRSGWKSFVIVLHSFELIRNRATPGARPSPDWLNVRRFHGLCEFLTRHRDKFHCALFADASVNLWPEATLGPLLRSGLARTAWRMAEQLVGRAVHLRARRT